MSNKYSLCIRNIFGVCLTGNGNNETFRKKYGEHFISFELETILINCVGFLFAHDVIYDLNNSGQYLYDLACELYSEGEYSYRNALNLTENDMPDNYDDMISRLYHYLKVLYKKEEFSFENEKRIIIDEGIINNGVVYSYVGENYYYTQHICKHQYARHVERKKFNGKDIYALKLDSFSNINLKKN